MLIQKLSLELNQMVKCMLRLYEATKLYEDKYILAAMLEAMQHQVEINNQ